MMRSEPPRWRRRWAWSFGLGLALALLAGLWLRTPETAPPPTAPHPPTPPTRALARDVPLPTPSAPWRPRAEQPPPKPTPPPIIDEVTVEKPEVCSGEDNLITVRAHSPDGNDAYLHSTIGTGVGMRVPLRVWLEEGSTYEQPRVTVFGKDNVSASVLVPRYTVKECEPERLVDVYSRRVPNSEEDYEFLVRIHELPRRDEPRRKPFAPVRFVWTFDDAPSVTTTVPTVTWTLSPQPNRPAAMYHQHLVRVEAIDASGRKATGRSSLQLLDPTFENFDKKGVVTVLAVGTPRFPTEDEAGVVRQRFRLFHRWRGPVTLERVTALRARRPEPKAPPLPEEATEASLGVETLPEGRGAEVSVSLDTKAEPDVGMITYVLEGRTTDGHPARGTFSLMRPPPRPTKENSVPVTDPRLLAKVKRARELLGQDFVTDEDLWRLEREGRFEDLAVRRATP